MRISDWSSDVCSSDLLLPAFCGALWLLDGAASGRQAALVGWAFGTGHFAAGLYWVGIAFLVDAERFGWAMPFAVAGLAAGLALFSALPFWLTRAATRRWHHIGRSSCRERVCQYV